MAADPIRIVAQVYSILGRPSQQKLPINDVHAARVAAGMEILRAIASNPQNGYHGSLCALVTVAHNAFLPAHDGEPGIPVITPFTAGAVMDGLVRDIRQIRAMKFPVFAGGIGPLDSKGRGKIMAIDVPVEVAGARVAPGDLVFGDADGVVVVPCAVEDRVIAEALAKVTGENATREALARGEKLADVFKRHGIL